MTTTLRHPFSPSPNPRTHSCLKCGKVEEHPVHAPVDKGCEAGEREPEDFIVRREAA